MNQFWSQFWSHFGAILEPILESILTLILELILEPILDLNGGPRSRLTAAAVGHFGLHFGPIFHHF